MKLKSKFLLIALVFLATSCGLLFGVKSHTFRSPEKEHWLITLKGYFNRRGVVKKDEILLSYFGRHKYSQTNINFYLEYKFLGKTGENLFEIESIEKGSIVESEKRKKYSVSFVEDRFYNLQASSLLYTGCSENDTLYLQMYALDDERLKYRIVLPDCLTKAIAANAESFFSLPSFKFDFSPPPDESKPEENATPPQN